MGFLRFFIVKVNRLITPPQRFDKLQFVGDSDKCAIGVNDKLKFVEPGDSLSNTKVIVRGGDLSYSPPG